MEVDERPQLIRRFATRRQRRMGLLAAFLGNVVPIVILGQYHQDTEAERLVVVVIGSTVAIAAPIAINLIPSKHEWLIRVAALSGLIGLTLMQAHSGGGGGVNSPYAILLVMPMIWFGLMTTGWDLRTGLLVAVACCFVPTLTLPQYYGEPSLTLGPALALAIVAVTVALSLAALTKETKVLTERLRDAATRDQLTGLLNRRGWEEVTQEVLSTVSDATTVSVVLVDLDGLKKLNDTMGHDEGDRELAATGARLASAFDDETAVSRLGGDEFALLLVGCTADQVHRRIEDLRRSTPDSGAFSAGIAVTGPGESLRDAMRRADLALYEVKTTGRGTTALADPPLSVDGS